MQYTVRHMPYTVNFRLRPTKKPAPVRNLRMHIYKDRIEATALWVMDVLAADWDSQSQKMKGRAYAEINNRLTQIRAEVDSIYHRQTQAGLIVTADTLRLEFKHKKLYEHLSVIERQVGKRELANEIKTWTPVDVLSEYIMHMEATARPKETIKIYQHSLLKLSEFTADHPGKTIQEISIKWGLEYYVWLQSTTDGKLKKSSAYTYINNLSRAIDHFIVKTNGTELKANPLRTGKWTKGESKEVLSLNQEAFDRFWNLRYEEKYFDRWWWYALMMLTGFDYPDAVDYVADRARYDKESPKGRVIVKNRKKTGGQSIVPIDRHIMADKFAFLFEQPIPAVLPTHKIYYYGKEVIKKRLGLDFRVTAKIARKSAGQLNFDKEHTIKFVSRLLGHKSVATTEKYYVRATLDTILNEL